MTKYIDYTVWVFALAWIGVGIVQHVTV